MLRTGRPWKGPWEVGMRVAYWKDDRAERHATRRKARPGYVLGVLINVDDSCMNGNVWCRSDDNLIVEVPEKISDRLLVMNTGPPRRAIATPSTKPKRSSDA